MTYLKTSLISAVSAIAIIAATPAFATDQNRATTTKDETRASTTMQGSAETAVQADELVGKDIKNAAGDEVGEIESVIIDKSGKVAAVIVSVGGFLGLGEHEVAIDWNDLEVRDNGDFIQTAITNDQLKAMPAYKYEKPDYRRSAFIDPAYVGKRMEAATNVEWVDAQGLKASKLLGSDVVNSQGETIGEVNDLVVADGRTMLILSVGEFLGMGGHDVAVELDKTKIYQQRGDADDLRVSVNLSKDQLKELPKYDSTKLNQR